MKAKDLSNADVYQQTCRKLCVRPLASIVAALRRDADVITATNKFLSALDMLSLAIALLVSHDLCASVTTCTCQSITTCV